MTAAQRWIVLAVILLAFVLAAVAVVVIPRSRFGSVPPNLPPLPCGDRVLTSTQQGPFTKAVCIRAHVWFYARGRWVTRPAPEDFVR
jgi:hypothetical protein